MQKLTPDQLRLYAVTASGGDLLQQVKKAIAGGVTMVQIREKHCTTQQLVTLAQPIVAYCRAARIPCLINDDVEAARLLGADGVHVGQQDMELTQARRILGKQAILGTSAHNAQEAIRAQQQGADYIGCGAVFSSSTKTDAVSMSRETLAEIRQAVSIPMVAIGGITAENALSLKGTGIDGIAVVSAIFSQPDITAAARRMRQIAQEICGGEGAS